MKSQEILKLEERLFNEVKDRGTCVSEPTAIMLASHDFKNIEELYQAQENFEKLILKFKNSSKYKELLEYHQRYEYPISEFQFCEIIAMHEWMYRNNEDIYDKTQTSVPIAIEKILNDEDKVGQCTALTGLMWAFGAVEGINLTAYSTIDHVLTCYNDTQKNIPLENTSKYNFTPMYPPVRSKKIKFPAFLAECFSNKGSAKNNLGDDHGAIKDYDEAIRLNPENEKAWNNRGVAKNQLRRYQEAIKDYEETIRLNPENEKAWNNRGVAKYRLGRYSEAIKDYKEAIRLNPENEKAWNNRGVAKYRLGRYSEAIKDYKEAIRLNPKYTTAQDNRKLALRKLNKFSRIFTQLSNYF
ncbi:MAG: TPR protein [archaeon GW2011_AR13]|nr:MAG: TPR protein [archaeon GW2011_AR13]HIH63216.1 tetratricopeptide repeat protein [Nanoarchaeota archaeon]